MLELKTHENEPKHDQAEKISVKKVRKSYRKRQKLPQEPEQPNRALFSAELPQIQKPKLPKTAFSFFADEHRAIVKEEKGKKNCSYK